MFDLESATNKRTFDLTFTMEDDTTQTLHILPPTLGVVKRMQRLSQVAPQDMYDELSELVLIILGRNKEKLDISPEIVDDMDIDQIAALLAAFREWLAGERKRKN